MKKQLWQYVRTINDDIAMIGLGGGATISITEPHPFAPELWLDFLNANPQSGRSMWSVYKEFARPMEDLKDWMDEQGHGYCQEMRDMRLLSRDEFLNLYPSELRADAERLHEGMSQVIDEDRPEMVIALARQQNRGPEEQRMFQAARETVTKGADIPPWFSAIQATNLEAAAVNALGSYELYLSIPEAKHRNLYLSVILSGMISSYRDGRPARRCAAPDCGIFFLPSPRSHDQRYHSVRCQNRHYKRLRRS